jgi:hypothetical protein
MAARPEVGLFIDAVVALAALEMALLVAARLRLGVGPSCASSIANGAAGIALLVALRAAVGDAPFVLIWACVTAALIAHVADLAMRWRASPRPHLVQTLASSSALAPESPRV